MFYVYLLKSRKSGETYIGFTDNLRRRFSEHNNGRSESTRYKIPWELIYYEAYKSKNDALRRERMLKYDGRASVWLKKRAEQSLL